MISRRRSRAAKAQWRDIQRGGREGKPECASTCVCRHMHLFMSVFVCAAWRVGVVGTAGAIYSRRLT